jgi:hypothetical protein
MAGIDQHYHRGPPQATGTPALEPTALHERAAAAAPATLRGRHSPGNETAGREEVAVVDTEAEGLVSVGACGRDGGGGARRRARRDLDVRLEDCRGVAERGGRDGQRGKW